MIFPMTKRTTESAAKISTKALTSAVQPIHRTTASPTAMIANGSHKRRFSPRPKNKRRSIKVNEHTKANITQYSIT